MNDEFNNRVFVFGTGRCGSTHLQRMITMNSDIWIWGEHGGLFSGLFQIVEKLSVAGAPYTNLVERKLEITDITHVMHYGGPELSWLNSIDRDELFQSIRNLLNSTFSRNIPEDWADWGFKEILYGYGNNVPEYILLLFSGSRCAFSFRDPNTTIRSMLRTWDGRMLNKDMSEDAVRKVIFERVNRWKTIVQYFINLQEKMSDRVVFVEAGVNDDDPEALLSRLGITFRARSDSIISEPTNRGPSSNFSAYINSIITDILEQERKPLSYLYHKAQEIAKI